MGKEKRARCRWIWPATLGVVGAAVGGLGVARLLDNRRLDRVEKALAVEPGEEGFSPKMVHGLPEPARRYLAHAIAGGTPLAGEAHLRMVGQMRVKPGGPWLDVSARETVSRRGFVWRAHARRGVVSFSGGDQYTAEGGRVSFWLWGLLPLVRQAGSDVSQAAWGRYLMESAWLPPLLLPGPGVAWEEAGDNSARAVVSEGPRQAEMTISVDERGSLQTMCMLRWGNLTDKGSWDWIPFGMRAQGERTFAGYSIPTPVSVAWWFGTDREFEFFRAEVTEADFR